MVGQGRKVVSLFCLKVVFVPAEYPRHLPKQLGILSFSLIGAGFSNSLAYPICHLYLIEFDTATRPFVCARPNTILPCN